MEQRLLDGNNTDNTESLRPLLYIFWQERFFGHSFAYVAHFVFLRDVWIRTQKAAVEADGRCRLLTLNR
jgi:hypothetical protein